MARNTYGNFSDSTLSVAIGAEQYNNLWYRQ